MLGIRVQGRDLEMSEVTPLVFEKYRNPDPRCTYPFTPEPCGYCWSYANHVDGDKAFKDMSTICPTCDLFKPDVKTGKVSNPKQKDGV